LEKILDDNEKLRKDVETRKIYQELEQKRFEEEEKLDHENIGVKKKLIDGLQMEKAQLFLVTEKDPRLQSLRDENEKLHKSVKEAEQRLDRTNYKVLETETLQALSLKKKEEDQETRKKLQAELEKWREQLDETIKSNELKVERKLREAESAQIKELQAVLLKERHELLELKNKLEAILTKEREYVVEQANRTRYRNDLIKKKETNLGLLKQLHDEIGELDPKVNDVQTSVEGLRIKIQDSREERHKLQFKLKEAEEENIVLLSKLQFMQNHVKLDEDMKKFNIDELRNVIQTNQTVNETIRDFMEKWDTLKKFSKMP